MLIIFVIAVVAVSVVMSACVASGRGAEKERKINAQKMRVLRKRI